MTVSPEGSDVALLIGVALALVVGVVFTKLRFDRDRAFYPTVAIVVAHYYVLFAVMRAPARTIVLEALAAAGFLVCAVLGFRSSLWLVVGALAAHGIFDIVHDAAISNPGVPEWWPGFCLGYDIAAAAYLSWLLRGGRIRVAA